MKSELASVWSKAQIPGELMFLEHYGLREQPFGVTPNPRYLYHSAMHREALASLIYGIESDLGFAALIAEPGMGKTTLLFYLLEKFRPTARTALIFQTLCTPLELLRYLANELEIETNETDPVSLNERIKNVLVQEARAKRRVIVIIDEAQNLDESVLETIRLLSDFETQNMKLLHIILAGQLQLAEKLARPCMSQLLQRVSMVNRLGALSTEETKNYIEYRLGVAGCRGVALFSPEAIQAIFGLSGGVPRKINRICFNALSLGCAMGKRSIDEEVIKEVGNDLDIGDLLFQKGAITDEPTHPTGGGQGVAPVKPPERATSIASTVASVDPADTNLPPVIPAPDDVPITPIAETAPARQWPTFPGRGPQPTPVVPTVTARTPGFSSPRPATATASGYVRPFMSPGAISPGVTGAGMSRPMSSAQPKPISVAAPVEPPKLVQSARPEPERAKPKRQETEDRSRVAILATSGLLLGVLAFAGWTLWGNVAGHETNAVEAASAQPKTSGQEVDLPASDNVPKIKEAIQRGRSAAKDRAANVQQDVVRVSARKSGESRQTQVADAGNTVVDFDPQNGSNVSSRAISAALIRRVQPEYPPEARRTGVQGSVTIAAVIGADGKPRNVHAVSGNPILARAAMDAVSQWLYQPYFVNGRPVEVETEVVVDFALK